MDDCFIGVSSIPDKYNQYRLGTIFLRNFYTGLNFDKNMLLIGLNQGTTSAELHGKAENPFRPTSTSGAVIFVVIFLVVMFLIALACFIRAKKNEKDRLVTFAPTTAEDMKKRYRNGVEVKPSEIKGKKPITSLN
jgi:hypothetical protein